MTPLIVLSFIKFHLTDLIDILLVSIILFQLFRLLKGTAAVRIFWGIAIIYVIWKLVTFFQMSLLSEILGQFISVGVIALIVVFQPEIRNFLLFIGNTRLIRVLGGRFYKKLNADDFKDEINAIVRACRRMSNSGTGALIVMERETPLSEYLSTGENIDAIVSRDLIENVFYKNSPLHDGAMIIKHHRIAAARCILPVSKSEDLPTDLGLRHRSAIGATILTDAIAIVVSEQTGQISYCKDGQITRDLSPIVLEQMLKADMVGDRIPKKE